MWTKIAQIFYRQLFQRSGQFSGIEIFCSKGIRFVFVLSGENIHNYSGNH